MKRCPSCGRTYADSEWYCEDDGEPLVPARNGSATPVAGTNSGGAAARAASWLAGIKLSKEAVVGFAIVAALIVTVIAFVSLRQSKQFYLLVEFQKGAHGLDVGDNVYVRNRKSGEVTRIDLDDHGRGTVTIVLRPDAAQLVRQDTWFYSGFDGPLGRKCLVAEVTGDVSSPLAERGQRFQGEDSQLNVRSRHFQRWVRDKLSVFQEAKKWLVE